jgi:hypothetical protein
MAKPDRQPAEPQKTEQPKPGLLASLKRTAKANLSPGKILGDIGAELTNQVAHGAHEAASALFRGDGFVMYPRAAQRNDQELSDDKMTLEQLRGHAEQKAQEAAHRMDHQNDQRDHGREM